MKPKVKLIPVKNRPELVNVMPTENIASFLMWAVLGIILMVVALSMTNGLLFWLAILLMVFKPMIEKATILKFRFTGDLIFLATAIVVFFGGGLIAAGIWLSTYLTEWYGRWVGYGHAFTNNVQIKDKLRHIEPEQIVPDTQ